MPSRAYVSSSGAPPVSPAVDASWTLNVAGVARRKLTSVPSNATMNWTTATKGAAVGTNINAISDQLVSDPIQLNRTITGTVTVALSGRATSLPNSYPRAVVKVVSGDGLTVRGILFSGVGTLAFGVAAPLGTRIVTGTVTPVAALPGDRIVVERGAQYTTAITSALSADLSVGDPYDKPDVAGTDDGNPTSFGFDYRPWVEFSDDTIWDPMQRRIASAAVQVADRTPDQRRQIASAAVEVADRTPVQERRIASAAVEVVRGRVGQQLRRRIHSIHGTEPLQKFPDIGWRVIRPVPLPSEKPPPALPLCLGYGVSVSSSASTSTIAPLKIGDILVFQCTTGNAFAQQGYSTAPAAITGISWAMVYGPMGASTPAQHFVWVGTVQIDNPVLPGSISIGHGRSDNATMLSAWRGVNVVTTGSDLTRVQPGSFPARLNALNELNRDRVVVATIAGGASTVVTQVAPVNGWTADVSGSTAKYRILGAPLMPLGTTADCILEMTSSTSPVSALMLVLE